MVRGDDLLDTTPRQLLVARLLGLSSPTFAHVPLVLGPDGERLAKRHGSVTLADQRALGRTDDHVLSALAASLDLSDEAEPISARDLVIRYDRDRLPRRPWSLPAALLEP